MLQIRDEQVSAFNKAMEGRFRKEASAALFKDYPAKFPGGRGDADLFAEEGLSEAKERAMCTEEEAMVFLRLRCLCGAEFVASGDYPAEAAILQAEDLTAGRRLGFLRELLGEHEGNFKR